jgi:hypothetical protein
VANLIGVASVWVWMATLAEHAIVFQPFTSRVWLTESFTKDGDAYGRRTPAGAIDMAPPCTAET